MWENGIYCSLLGHLRDFVLDLEYRFGVTWRGLVVVEHVPIFCEKEKRLAI